MYTTTSKQVLVFGINEERASDNAHCIVSITDITLGGNATDYINAYTELATYFSGDYEGDYIIGESDTCIGRSLEHCLKSMLPTEVSSVKLSINKQNEKNTILGTVVFTIKLHSVTNREHIFEIDNDRKYEIAMDNKLRGVTLFQLGRIEDSFFRFSKAIKYLISIDSPNSNAEIVQSPTINELQLILYNNMASCQLKLGNFEYTVALCNKVLTGQTGNVKALFRRAVANVELRRHDDASEDLKAVLTFEPGNRAAADKLKELCEISTENRTNYTNVVKKMFKS